MMENEEVDISFRDYINNNVNLLTVLGIFNALAIYSGSVKNYVISEYLGFIFTAMSSAIVWLLLVEVHKSESKIINPGILLFKIGLFMLQFIFITMTAVTYPKLSCLTITLLFFFFVIKYTFHKLFNHRWFLKDSTNNSWRGGILAVIIFMIYMIIVFSISLLVGGLLNLGLDRVIKNVDVIQKEKSSEYENRAKN